jgi:hypothetical protein
MDHAAYMREYNQKNKERINTRRKERRVEKLDEAREQSRVRNRRYYKKNKDKINARAKDRNWNYNKETAAAKRAHHYERFPVRNLFRQRKQSALKKGLPFDLTEEWYEEQFEKGCAVTGIPFDKHRSDTPWVPHIDRRVPERGYTQNNCRLVCACYNLAKKHWTDADVLRMAHELLRTSDA